MCQPGGDCSEIARSANLCPSRPSPPILRGSHPREPRSGPFRSTATDFGAPRDPRQSPTQPPDDILIRANPAGNTHARGVQVRPFVSPNVTTTGPEHNRQVFDEYIQMVRPRLREELRRFAKRGAKEIPHYLT